MKTKPGVRTGSAYSYTSIIGEVPPLATAPSDFSRMLLSPPALLPGDGIVVEAAVEAVQIALVPVANPSSFSATPRLRARRTSRCSAPKISVVSASTGAAADLGQHIGANAQRRIRRHARKRIRAAAIQAQHDLRSRRFGTPLRGRTLDQARDLSARGLHGAASSAAHCKVMPTRRSARGAFGPR